MPPTAIVLAGGVSRRLYPLTYNQPKCLLELGGTKHYPKQCLGEFIDLTKLSAGFARDFTPFLAEWRPGIRKDSPVW